MNPAPNIRETCNIPMAVLPIIIAPDPRLKACCEPVEQVNGEIVKLMDDLLASMYAARGIGLSAPQVGVCKRVIVVDTARREEEPKPLAMANPEIAWVSEEMVVSRALRPGYPPGPGRDALSGSWQHHSGDRSRWSARQMPVPRNGSFGRGSVRRSSIFVEARHDPPQTGQDEETGRGRRRLGDAPAMPCLRLVFMASAEFALPVLAALLDAGHEIVCVYSRPPRPAGRGHRERPSPVHAFAAEKAISVRTPKSLDGKDDQAAFAALAADAAVVAAYGLILPAPVLDAPRLGCLNVHASLLPRWRGAAPIERAIIAGDEQSGVTIIRMNEGLDSGPMVLGESVPITAETTAGDLRGALCGLGARLIVEALDGLAEGCLTPMPQPAATSPNGPRRGPVCGRK